MDANRLNEIRRFYQQLVPRLRKDPAPLSGIERAAVIRLMGELISNARSHPTNDEKRP